MEGDVRLMWFYTDRLDDREAADRLVRQLYAWGATHVQMVSGEGREEGTAYTFTVEVHAADEWRVADGLARRYGIARYHRLGSSYRYQPVTTAERPIIVRHADEQVGLTVRFGLIGTERDPMHVRVREDDVVTLHERIAQAFNLTITPDELRHRLEALLADENGFVLDWGVGEGAGGKG